MIIFDTFQNYVENVSESNQEKYPYHVIHNFVYLTKPVYQLSMFNTGYHLFPRPWPWIKKLFWVILMGLLSFETCQFFPKLLWTNTKEHSLTRAISFFDDFTKVVMNKFLLDYVWYKMMQIISITDDFTIYFEIKIDINEDFSLYDVSTFIAAGAKWFKSFNLM